MELTELTLDIDYVGSCGVVLNPEQKATLQTSLVMLKHENDFVNVIFWGIVRGVSGDYFIAQGIGKDWLTDRKTLYR